MTNSLSDTFGSRQNREMKVNFDDLASASNGVSNYNFSSKGSEMQTGTGQERQYKSQMDDIEQMTELGQRPTERAMMDNEIGVGNVKATVVNR